MADNEEHKHKVQNSYKASVLLRNTLEMQDFSRIIHICHYVLETQHLEGDMVEFGCFCGHTSKLISFISDKLLYVYDSFEGLPESEENLPGEMKTTLDLLCENFTYDGIRLPYIRKGWFSDITPNQVPEKISFAHLDGDLYISIMDPLKLIYDRMVPGGIILVDDYGNDQYWAGARKAVDEFFADKPEDVVELKGLNGALSHKALITKL
jgi:O-methyltransferase